MDQKHAETLQGLQDYLERIAYSLVINHFPDEEPQDLLQEMNLFIIEQAESNPTFLDQKPGYISKKCAWVATDWARTRARHGSKHTPMDIETGDDEMTAEYRPEFSIELHDIPMVMAVRDALETLDERAQEVAKMMLQGYKRKEIASELGIKSQSLTGPLGRVKAALAPVYAVL